MLTQQKATIVHFQEESVGFDSQEIEIENYTILGARCMAAREDLEAAVKMYGFSPQFGKALAALTEEDILKVSRVGYSLLELNTEKFTDTVKVIDNFAIHVRPKLSEDESVFRDENRGAFVRRWHLIKLAKTESLRRFNIAPVIAEEFKKMTYEKIDRIANCGIPFFKLTENLTIVNLAKIAQSPKDLALLMVLRD